MNEKHGDSLEAIVVISYYIKEILKFENCPVLNKGIFELYS